MLQSEEIPSVIQTFNDFYQLIDDSSAYGFSPLYTAIFVHGVFVLLAMFGLGALLHCYVERNIVNKGKHREETAHVWMHGMLPGFKMFDSGGNVIDGFDFHLKDNSLVLETLEIQLPTPPGHHVESDESVFFIDSNDILELVSSEESVFSSHQMPITRPWHSDWVKEGLAYASTARFVENRPTARCK